MARQPEFSITYCESLIEQMTAGKTISQWCRGVGISRTTYYNWVERYEDFAEAHDLGVTFAQAWYDDQAREAIRGIKVYDENTGKTKYLAHPMNTAVYLFTRKNRFGERDVHQDEPTNNTKLLTKIKDMLPT